ncbi:hypothetical protein L3556_01335 [Candidatus Synechococcus calcipolaris G9]|uniref:Glycosyltransferase subfamily 4-like N-terminal domain-containing protein n=1 Tax=Candidatus Synechococcus calcipolaris G9 TaxID=1497997 RepID=A0ABT6EUQ1_9SYNE|nr:hypothetical protein [Candidatus Synechococcus calcipolaris]MDG2989580.1 hypothetical protein [Candidatus Synechococcus calcipolaris G9]
MQKALLMCFSDISTDPRPRRTLESLNQVKIKTDLTAYSICTTIDINSFYLIKFAEKNVIFRFFKRIRNVLGLLIRLLPINSKIKNLINAQRYRISELYDLLKNNEYDIIIVEDIYLLSLAFQIRKNARVMFDAREYYPKQQEDSLIFNWLEKPERIRLCQTYLPQCDHVITVSPGLSQAYYQEFNVVPHVIRSTPVYQDIQPQKTDENLFRMVYHGAANRNRQLENMIEVVKQLDERFTLDFYLVSNSNYIKFLKKQAHTCDRIRFNKPVPFEQIIPMLTNYDIGFFYVEPTTFNLRHCLPNKLFEFIQARLLVAIGPSPDMAAIVRQYNCGVVAESFSIHAMVKALDSLNPDLIDKAKQNSHRAAKELCFEKEQKKLIKLIFNPSITDTTNG